MKTKTLHIDVDLTVNADADPTEVADGIMAGLFATYDELLVGVVSIDGAEPILR